MNIKIIGILLIFIGVGLLILGVPLAEMAVISYTSGFGTITAEGLSPYSVASIIVGFIITGIGVFLIRR